MSEFVQMYINNSLMSQDHKRPIFIWYRHDLLFQIVNYKAVWIVYAGLERKVLQFNKINGDE